MEEASWRRHHARSINEEASWNGGGASWEQLRNTWRHQESPRQHLGNPRKAPKELWVCLGGGVSGDLGYLGGLAHKLLTGFNPRTNQSTNQQLNQLANQPTNQPTKILHHGMVAGRPEATGN